MMAQNGRVVTPPFVQRPKGNTPALSSRRHSH
jgi:hypothetical protein